MSPNNKISNTLKNKVFTLKEAEQAGLTRARLEGMLKKGLIMRLGHNQYQYYSYPDTLTSQFQSATKILGEPCAIALISALEFYDLTDEINSKIWVIVPKNKISRRKELRLLRLGNPNWELGILKHSGFCITSIERTIIECLKYQRLVGTNVAINAIRQAIRDKGIPINKIASMAKKLGHFEKIKPYIEAHL